MKRWTLLAAIGTATASIAPAQSAGLPDPGFLDGRWRSDFASAAIGTAMRPLNYDPMCPFPQSPFAICLQNLQPLPGQTGSFPPRVYSRSNWVGLPGSAEPFWVVTANVEPTLDRNCNSGPPNQSEPVVRPFEGVFGLSVQPAETTAQPYRNEVVLAVDLSHRPRQRAERPSCKTDEFIPFLSYGLDSARGAGGPLAELGPEGPSPLLRFNYRLVDSNADMFDVGQPLPPKPRGQYAGLFVEAQWQGRKRWVWINLVKAFASDEPAFTALWNWGLRESMFYPGAEIVFTSAAWLSAHCPNAALQLPASLAPAPIADNAPHPVSIDLRALYQCVGDRFEQPFPSATPVPLTGLHFFVEVGVRDRDGLPGLSASDYDSRLGIAFDSVDLAASGTPAASDHGFLSQLADDLLGRPWTATELAHWASRLSAVGRIATSREILRSLPVRRGALTAARLALLGFGDTVNRAALESLLAGLRAGEDEPAAARRLAADPAFVRVTRSLGDEAFIRLLWRRALGRDLDAHPDVQAIVDAVGSIAEWRAALQQQRATRADFVLAVHRFASARNLLTTEAEIVLLYRAFMDLTPDSEGVAHWRQQPHMPERLIEVLYYTDEYRRRFAD